MSRAVIDQPGMRILIIGLALSLFLGLALRSQTSDSRVQVYLSKSIDRLQTDFYIDYESAKVNLSRWGLPLPALVVKNLRMSPKSTICQSSQIFIEELEVPISVATLLGFSKIIPKIRVLDIELRLSDIEDCFGPKKDKMVPDKHFNAAPAESLNTETDYSTSFETDFNNIFSKNTKAELKEIFIEKIKIISKNKPDQPILLKQINIDLVYDQNRLAEVQIKSKINALKDSRSDVYFLSSNLVVMLKSKEKNQIESLISINGKLLDGDIQMFLHSFSGTNKLTYELALQQVSLKALGPILENLDFYKNLNSEKIPVSLSIVNSGELFLGDPATAVSKFKKVSLFVENGTIKINDLEASYSGSQLKIKPFVMSVEALSLTKLKNVDQFKNRLDSVDNLGELSGQFEFKNENNFKFAGAVKNIKAVFSNRGRRDLQNIDSIDIEVLRNEKDLKLDAKNFKINNSVVEGQLRALYNTGNFTTSAQLKLSGITLTKKIWDQFTFVEQSPTIDLNWNYKKAEEESHNIKIFADKIRLPGILLENLNVDMQQVITQNNMNTLRVNIKPLKLTTDPSFLDDDIVNKVLNSENGFKLETLNSAKTQIILSGADWKNLSINLDSYFLSDASSKSETHLSFKGSVKNDEGFFGRLLMQSRQQSSKFDFSRDVDDRIVIRQLN